MRRDATSRFRRNKNRWSAPGAWRPGATTCRGDTTAHGIKIDDPNDEWDLALTYKLIKFQCAWPL